MIMVKTIVKKILKISFIIFIILLFLISINNCKSINKGKKLDLNKIINNPYINADEDMYLFLYSNKGRLQINEDNEYIILTFDFTIDNGVINCINLNYEINSFSLIVLEDNSLYCKYLNELFYKVNVEV